MIKIIIMKIKIIIMLVLNFRITVKKMGRKRYMGFKLLKIINKIVRF